MHNIVRALKEIRVARGISQDEVEKGADLPVGFIYGAESERNKSLDLYQLEKYAAFMDLTIDYKMKEFIKRPTDQEIKALWISKKDIVDHCKKFELVKEELIKQGYKRDIVVNHLNAFIDKKVEND